MAGGGVCKAGTERTTSPKTQIRETSFMGTSPVLLVHVWALSNAPALRNHRKRL